MRNPLSLYVHIPFCSLKCSYCDFNSYANLEHLVPEFTRALTAEMRLWSPAMAGRPVPTVFFGGGTPTLLPLEHMQSIMEALRGSFELTADAEITTEANPGTINLDYLRGLVALSFNRLSFGVQSFDDSELLALDRIHTADDARQGYAWARQAGFPRINLDLIYGLPVQTLERWQSNVEQALALGPEHLSLYALTVEEGTKLAYDIDHGRVPEPDGDLQADMWDWSRERMAAAGYEHYEISNWARPGEECRHNLVYWQNGDWLGVGPGAHSLLAGVRFADVYSPAQYVRLVDEAAARDLPEAERDLIHAMPQVTFVDEQTPELQMADTAILALRLNDGLDVAAFEERFGTRIEALYGPQLAELTSLGFLERANCRLRLTDRGRYLANEVFVRLLPD
ncbi:MAG TPA: radical SAM family heme chaperone HemW [Dehalococcoidia bacterium]|jgi:oxygen-independent coproporphyrinogen-3 oxidase